VNLGAMADEEPGSADARALLDGPSLASFDDFYRRSLQPMVRLAYLLTAGSPAAEELVQEAFIRVHAHWQEVEHPAAYLRQAVVNRAASHRRRAELERRIRPLRRLEPVDAPVDELRDAVAKLPDRQRAAVVLRYYEDLSDADIADALGCRIPAVKSLLHRALKDLRKVVER
jgi:RNA polymerase sigma-70 factor (sigma-E family)